MFTARFEVLKTDLEFILFSFGAKDGQKKRISSAMTIKTRDTRSPKSAASDSAAVTVLISNY